MKQMILFVLMGILLFSFASAGTCSVGSTECSDGEDNDKDGLYDYYGLCSDTDVDCSSYKTAANCASACEAVSGAVYTEADTDDCVSPLDIYEGTGTGATAYGAPSLAPEEEGIFGRFIDWLIFWD